MAWADIFVTWGKVMFPIIEMTAPDISALKGLKISKFSPFNVIRWGNLPFSRGVQSWQPVGNEEQFAP